MQQKKGRNFTSFYLRAQLTYGEKHYKYSFCEHVSILWGFTEGNLYAVGPKLHPVNRPTCYRLVLLLSSALISAKATALSTDSCYPEKVMIILVFIFSLATLRHGSLCELLLTLLAR